MKYKLIKKEYIEELHTDCYLYEHQKSGARLLALLNDDENKVFSIGFRTPPVDSTGVPHIMEHSTLCGSAKFPVKDPFVELLKGSLNTFLNAMTFSDKTIYPVASLNDKDFNNLMEVYLDAVFYPNVYKHEEIFKQEGWHYELDDETSEIKLNGVVYNEMKGAFSSPEEIVGRESLNSLFPDNTYGVESGGDPLYIPDLTYDNFKNFHKKYYSPSNSYIVLYGKMDIDEKMDFIDKEYLSKFDRIEVDSKIEYQKPFNEPAIKYFKYPVAKDTKLENKTYYTYNVQTGDNKDSKLMTALSILSYVILEMPGAPLKQALVDKEIGQDIISNFDDGVLQPFMSIMSKDSKANSLDEFKNTIHDTLLKLRNDGIDKKSLYSAINLMEFRIREGDYGSAPKGLLYTIISLSTWLYDDNNPTSRLYYDKIFKELKDDVEKGYFEELIDKYFLNNNHVSYCVFDPSTTLADEEENKLKEKLKKYKDSLSKEEIIKLIEDTKALKLYQETPSTKEELDTIPKLSRNDIKKNDFKYYNTVVYEEGIKIVKHEIETNGIGYLSLFFDSKKINPEYIPYLGLLTQILGKVDTKNYKYQELVKDININTGGMAASFSAYTILNDSLPYFIFDTKYLYGNEKFVFDTFKEIIINTIYDNKTRLKEIIQELVSELEMDIIGAGHRQAIMNAMSYIRKSSYYSLYTSGIKQYEFLKDILNDFNNKIDKVIEVLKEVAHTIFRKENLIISETGLNNDDFIKYINDFKESLFNDDIKEYSFDFKENIKNEAFKTSSKVQFNAQVGMMDKNEYKGYIPAFLQALSYDYLWIKVRVQGGAYGSNSNIDRDGYFYFSSYRDPNLKETYDIYKGIVDFIDKLDYSEEDITKFIIGAIGNQDFPLSNRQKGEISMTAYIRGTKLEDINREREELLNATLDDFKKLKPLYEKVLKENIICCIGNENKIAQNKELFKEIKSII